MTVPQCLSLAADNSLRTQPAAELQSLRFDPRRVGPMASLPMAIIGVKTIMYYAVMLVFSANP